MKFLRIKKTPLVFYRGLYLKREDLQVSGSVKDRGMVEQLRHLPKGTKNVVISSSGNAGISLAFWGRKLNLQVNVFASPKLPSAKKERLLNLGARLYISRRPLSESIRFARQNGFPHLRQSVSKWARYGFQLLGEELKQEIRPDAIFFPVSSGTTLLGVSDAWGKDASKPLFVLVQPAGHCPLARHFVACPDKEDNILTTALVARYIPHQKGILNIIGEYGRAIVVNNKEIEDAWQQLKKDSIVTSFEGAAAVAAAWQMQAAKQWRRPVCLLTGKYYG